jgi:hypothetical protein
MTLIVMATACTAAPRPTPTPPAEPTPSPTPVDVAMAFADALLDPGLTVEGVITGSITGAGQEGTISGSVGFAGRNSRQALEISFAGAQTATEVITADGDQYTRTGDGPWVHQPVGTGTTLQALFDEILQDLEDDGVEQVDGESLRHLVPATPVDLSADAFGLTNPAITEFSGSVDFYAKSDGTPAILRFALAWKQADTAIDMELQYVLDLDATPRIARPDDVWTSFDSDRFAYTIAYPELWVMEELDNGAESGTYDLFYALPSSPGPAGEIQVWFRSDTEGVSAADWFAGSSGQLAEGFGVELEASEPITVGSLESRYIALHYVAEDGARYFAQFAIVFAGDHAWNVIWYSAAGNEANDRAVFDSALTTFKQNDASSASG